jgi:regulation of enolase protein 1 (concanavalin A-like superfamily)
MIHTSITVSDWSLVDCHEYIMDLEMGVTRAVAALEVASPDSKRENRAETMKKLEDPTQVSRDLALGLRQEHLNW